MSSPSTTTASFRSTARAIAAASLDLAHTTGALRPARAHRGQLVVLTLHRVLPAEQRAAYPYPGLVVTPEELDALLAWLEPGYAILPIDEATARFAANPDDDRPSLALTFDDGQHDNLVHAAPVLASHGVRATFYVPTDAIDEGSLLWHDRFGFAFGALAAEDPSALRALLRDHGLRDLADDATVDVVVEATKALPPARRAALVDALVASARTPSPDFARMMTWDEVRELASAGHEIGSHAVTHTPLPQLDEAGILDECTRSKARIEAELGRPVRSLCYPNGDADARCLRAAEAAGYANAVTTRFGTNGPSESRFALRRIDVDARRFSVDGAPSAGLFAVRLAGLHPGTRRLAAEGRAQARGDVAGAYEVAYLVSEYPARSHTFVRREIAALRERGAIVHPFAIRRADASTMRDDLERDAYAETFPILPAPPLGLALSHARALARRPVAYAKTFASALGHRLPGPKSLVWSVFHFLESVRLAEELERRGVRHLHVHFANAGAQVGRLAAQQLGIPYSLSLHGTSDFEYPAGPLLGAKVREAEFAVCISHFGRAQAMRLLPPSAWSKLLVVRCGVEADAIPPRVARDDAEIRVVCVGRLSSEKGHLGLVEAFAIASAKDPRLVLHLVGDGPLRGAIEARIRELGLEAKVRMFGAVSEPAALRAIAECDLFALPSLMEGIPMVLMEAMAIGVPVIAPSVAGIPELVVNDRTGLLYIVGRIDELAASILRLASDEGLRARLADAGREKVLAEFVVDRSVAPLHDAFRARLA